MKAKLPQFVVSRLAQTPVPEAHPDAELLTAFSEGALSSGERAEVTAHLAACAHCRACLALAFGTQEPIVVPHAEPETGRVHRWTWFWAVRWALPALVACAALVLVLKQGGGRQHPILQASNRVERATPATRVTPNADSGAAARAERPLVGPQAGILSQQALQPVANPARAEKPGNPSMPPSQETRIAQAAEAQSQSLQPPPPPSAARCRPHHRLGKTRVRLARKRRIKWP